MRLGCVGEGKREQEQDSPDRLLRLPVHRAVFGESTEVPAEGKTGRPRIPVSLTTGKPVRQIDDQQDGDEGRVPEREVEEAGFLLQFQACHCHSPSCQQS